MEEPIEKAESEESLASSVLNNLIYEQKFSEAQKLLEESKGSSLITAKDEQGLTVMHYAAIYGSPGVLSSLVQYIKVQNEFQVKNFLNLRDKEGETPLLFAAFRGEIAIFECLLQYGADLHLSNLEGHTVMHKAAMGDQVHMLALLRKKGINIDIKNRFNQTPLMLAAEHASEEAANFLIAWGADINQQDKETGKSVLHFAVEAGSRKIVRKLLLRGADRTLSDLDGHTPMDISLAFAKENAEFFSLVRMFDEGSWLKRCLSMKTPLRPPTHIHKQYILYVAYLLLRLVFSTVFVMPYAGAWAVIIAFYALAAAEMLCLALAKRDPGYFQKRVSIQQRDLVEVLASLQDLSRFCPDCEIVMPKRSRHCESCNRCVKVFDHHCPWIDNCVGAHNYCSYYTLLVAALVNMAFQLVFHLFYLEKVNVQDVFVLFEINKEVQETFHAITSVTVIVMSIFILPLFMLLYQQTHNLFRGITTNERYVNKKSAAAQNNSPEQAKANTTQSPKEQELVDASTGNFAKDQNNSLNTSQTNTIEVDLSSNELQGHRQSKRPAKDAAQRRARASDKHTEERHATASYTNCLNTCFRNKDNSEYGLRP